MSVSGTHNSSLSDAEVPIRCPSAGDRLDQLLKVGAAFTAAARAASPRASPPVSALLEGPPGTGKTAIAAHIAQVRFCHSPLNPPSLPSLPSSYPLNTGVRSAAVALHSHPISSRPLAQESGFAFSRVLTAEASAGKAESVMVDALAQAFEDASRSNFRRAGLWALEPGGSRAGGRC